MKKNWIKHNSVDLTEYEFGHRLWQAHEPLPLTASRALRQGYVKGAREQYRAELATMREQHRRSLFEFLPQFHACADWRKPLKTGENNSYWVRIARAQAYVSAQFQGEEV